MILHTIVIFCFVLKGLASLTNPYTEWIMMPNDKGEPTLAILDGPQINARANTLHKFKIYMFTKENKEGIEISVLNDDELREAGFKPEVPTKVLTHGFSSTIHHPAVQDVKDAYLETSDYNVIALDWSQLCPSPWYQVAVTNSVDAGKYLGSFIDLLVGRKMTRLQDVHIIGHSLGAHVAGIAGGSVQSGKVGRVTGLDPAYPLFSKRTVKERLDASDATLVDTIHTCGKFLGIFEPQGHIDFYPNRGLSAQPGCGVDMFGVCSHSRAHEFFTESIRKKYMFVATQCHTIEEMMDKHCTGSKGRMGEDISDMKPGVYYLEINETMAIENRWYHY